MNLATNIARNAQIHADRVAVRLGDQGTIYREFDERSRRVAGLLAERGCGPADRVRIMLPNIPDFAAVYDGRAPRGCRRRADEPAAEGPRGHPLPRRFRRRGGRRIMSKALGNTVKAIEARNAGARGAELKE